MMYLEKKEELLFLFSRYWKEVFKHFFLFARKKILFHIIIVLKMDNLILLSLKRVRILINNGGKKIFIY